MTRWRLLWHSLAYYWRTNLAVLLGVVAATAVMGGALIVGDSVRGSLRQMTLARLGRIDHVLQSPRFFGEALAARLAATPRFAEKFGAVAPAILLPASLERARSAESEQISRAGGVNLFGVNDLAWQMTLHDDVPVPTGREIILSARVAEQLNVQAGAEVLVAVELPSDVPRDSLLGKKDQTTTQVPFTVKVVLPESSGVGRIGLRPDQQLPLNAFVALETIQDSLELQRVPPSRRNPEGAEPRVNTLFVTARDDAGRLPAAAQELTAALRRALSLSDLDLRLVTNSEWHYFSLESRRMLLEEPVTRAAALVAEQQKLVTSPVYVSLANEISTDHGDKTYAMYSVIAGIDLPAQPPFGPLEFVDPASAPSPLQGDEMILNDWLATDLQAKIGDAITVKYYQVGSRGELPELTHTFRVKGIVKLEGTRAADRGLTPEVKGITDAKTLSDWEQPFEMKFDRIPKRDEDYWDKYRATPKAFVSLATAQGIWPSRYGKLTSYRMAPQSADAVADAATRFTQQFLKEAPLAEMGLSFAPVKYAGLQAAGGTTDFSGLFIGFSFFLIVSATILIGLLFRLGIERRGSQVGLLLATGLTPRQVSRLLLGEGLLVVALGGLLGLLAAVGYAHLMIYGLKTWWIGAIGTRFLDVYLTPMSLIGGFGLAFIVAFGAVWWGLRQLGLVAILPVNAGRAISVRGLLAGQTERSLSTAEQRQRGRAALITTLVSAGLGLALLLGVVLGAVPGSQAFAGFSWQTIAFFVVGMALLVAGISSLAAWLDSDRSAAVKGRGILGMGRLGLRNAARYRMRSVLTVGLLASATFVVVAVAAGQRNPAVEKPDKFSGNGGFTLVAESAAPILFDLNTPEGRDKLSFGSLDDKTRELVSRMHVEPFRMKPGDNASCLNIYQTQLPTLLGVPAEMIDRGGFKFVGHGPQEKTWELLRENPPEDRVPVFGDMNTLMYSMHKGLGDKVFVPDAEHPRHTLEISAMFDGAVFQGVLLMEEGRFQQLFPELPGYRYFLIECPLEDAAALSELLETRLNVYGFDAERVADRLADFLAVQNTYLSTFQTLGGLGLLLGTLGLATVMLRNVLERRAELALLRAVGFRPAHLAWLVLWENTFLLVWGLAAGTISALLAMLPHLLSIGADVPWSSGGWLLGAILAAGMAAAFLAVREALRTPVLATLRSEN